MRTLSIMAVIALFMVACGGDGEGADETAENEVPPTAVDDTDIEKDSSSGEDRGGSGLDRADLPDPGKKRVEVDGQTFVFTGEDCNISDTEFGLSGRSGEEGDRYGLLVSGTMIDDLWAITIALGKTGENNQYTSSGGDVDTPTIDGAALVVEGNFYLVDFDDNSQIDVGRGRLVANCG